MAKTPTVNGGDPSVVRIRNITPTGFEVNMQEWYYKDGNHIKETVYYTVMELGSHDLPGGIKAVAGKENTDKEYTFDGSCLIDDTNSVTVNYGNTLTDPIVVSSVIGYSNTRTVTSRVHSVGSSNFKLFLQEEEKLGGRGLTDVNFIAIEKGIVNDTSNLPNWQLEVAKFSGVSNADKTNTFAISPAFPSAPFFISSMQTDNDQDTAVLRLKSLSATSAKVFVEEEKSCDSEVTHGNEEVGFFAFSGGIKEFNMALVVANKPEGLLHDIESKVRLGVSFYRYNPNANDIYNQNVNGGTMNFKLPNNPFVKKPTNTSMPAAEQGYRDVSNRMGMSANAAADLLENYPLVWGTTPLAENLWEVIRYLEQEPPRYTAVGGVNDFDPDPNTVDDPYYDVTEGRTLECIDTSVIVFTDGEPYQDSTVPGFTPLDFDGDSNADDLITNKSDLLDDVAYYGFCATVGGGSGNCADPVTGDGDRDLRTDIAGDQFVKVYTVAFGANSIPQVLQDTADNAGGIAYLAGDGAALETALTAAFTAAINDSSSSAVSVNTGSLSSDTTVFQARFSSNDWTGEMLAFLVNPNDGTLGTGITASYLPTTHGARIIATHNGTIGVPFRWPANTASPTPSELTTVQSTLLVSSDLLDYLRGDDSNEQSNGGTYRDRPKVENSISKSNATLNSGLKDRIPLGDMVNSSPVYVSGKPDFNYPDNLEGNSNLYSTFVASVVAQNDGKKCGTPITSDGRLPVIYVGSNDGMLHAFNANSLDCDENDVIDSSNFGSELFAYVPSDVLKKLPALAQPNYSHQYTVDGSPVVVDAFFSSAWHTVLVGGLRAGGQGLYALDVTDPGAITSEADLAAKVLWEFNDADDQDLGYTYSRPNIVRMQNGDWAAVFGNGYNNTVSDANVSTTGNAVLYIVRLSDGVLLKKIDTGVGLSDPASGKATDAAGNITVSGRPNGLASVSPVDVDGDSKIDYIYGGDLYGNLWKFDVNSGTIADWNIFHGGTSVAPTNDKPLFITQGETTANGYCVDGSDGSVIDGSINTATECIDTFRRQPITTRPEVNFHPNQSGFLVYFGTGQYIETTDNAVSGQLDQSYYGIWDQNDPAKGEIVAADLLEQEITQEVDIDGDSIIDARVTTDNAIDWEGDPSAAPAIPEDMGWFMDLYNKEGGNTNNHGERQVSDSILRNGRIIFTTLHPSANVCDNGGGGWLMEVDAVSGARLPYSPFDFDGSGTFGQADFVTISVIINGTPTTIKVPASGKHSNEGIISTPGIIAGDGIEYKYNSGSSGGIMVTGENPGPGYEGRVSWKQLSF
ncbi:pilus assembly protein [sulfur-oxidizing endosymbiont of Gigantopelta aegis]|uniref:pilus assembly protein n=1 Tax=sulfur-oxidizing endosymbiont of Gigantopelta aegis TaxID=2794934 RepID=UPI0018DCD6EE|nr:PilC/PilY family type IV pilus protein [sulfur-oxidizing endosymbiont of Gigantopelta aegis]